MSDRYSEQYENNPYDWDCRECGTSYHVGSTSPEDVTYRDLPDLCIECGDTIGWENSETGRQIP